MTERELFRAIGSVDEELVVEAESASRSKPSLTLVVSRFAMAAACAAIVVGISLTRSSQVPQLLPKTEAAGRQGIMMTYDAAINSPMGMRKFFHHNGYRYAFVNDGAVYDLDAFSLSESLGTLDHDILEGMNGFGENAVAEMDGATTFALGGELYAISGYDAAFRLAVLWEGDYYLAELVGQVDNTPMDPSYYFHVSELESKVKAVQILDHMGSNPLYLVSRKNEAKKMVRLFADSHSDNLSNENYAAIARAQMEGGSWKLELQLDDGTSIFAYIYPDLGYVSIGDDTYILPERFLPQYESIFRELAQDAPPFYG